MDGLSFARSDTTVKKKTLKSTSPGLRLHDPCGFQDAWVNGVWRQGKARAGPIVEPLFDCESESCRPGVATLTRVCAWRHPWEVLADSQEHGLPRDTVEGVGQVRTRSGSSQNVLVHCLVVRTASHPALVWTPTWTGSRVDLMEEPTSSVATLQQSLRSDSPAATGRRDPFLSTKCHA